MSCVIAYRLIGHGALCDEILDSFHWSDRGGDCRRSRRSPHSSRYWDDDGSGNEDQLDAKIPVGTSLAEAGARLRERGFDVSRQEDGAWGNRNNADYLYGDMREGLVVKRRWQIAVFYKSGVVTGIEVTTGLIGP